MDDNSVEMKNNLVQSLHRLRIDAECEVLEIGDMEMYDMIRRLTSRSQYAYEKTLMLRTREEFLRRIEDQNVLNMPVSTLRRKGSTGSPSRGSRKMSLSSSMFKSFSRAEDSEVSLKNDEMPPPGAARSSSPSGKTLHTNISVFEDECVIPVIEETPSAPTTANRIDKSAQMMNTAVKLNALIKMNSGEGSECRLVVCNLPAPGGKAGGSKGDSVAYVEYLTTLTEDLPRVMLLKGTGTEVVTNYV
jgi:hypothetical protein